MAENGSKICYIQPKNLRELRKFREGTFFAAHLSRGMQNVELMYWSSAASGTKPSFRFTYRDSSLHMVTALEEKLLFGLDRVVINAHFEITYFGSNKKEEQIYQRLSNLWDARDLRGASFRLGL